MSTQPRRGECSICPLPSIGSRPSFRKQGDSSIVVAYESDVIAPAFVPVLVTRDGAITFVGRTGSGHTVVIEHDKTMASSYRNLVHAFPLATDRFSRRRKQRVCAGDVIGYVRGERPQLTFDVMRDHVPADALAELEDSVALPIEDLARPPRAVVSRSS